MDKRLFQIAAGALIVAPLPAQSPPVTAPPNGGTISIEAAFDGEAGGSTTTFVNAAGDALAERGFTVLSEPGHAAYVARIMLSRVEVGTGRAKVAPGKASALPGGAYGSVGAGITIPLSTGKSTIVPLQRVQLELRISRRGQDGVIWHGAAMTVRAAGTPKGTDEAVARDLSEAVLRPYPAQSDDVVGVP